MDVKTYPRKLNEMISILRTDMNNVEDRLRQLYKYKHQEIIDFSTNFVEIWNEHFCTLEYPQNESNEDFSSFLKQLYLSFVEKYNGFEYSILAKDISLLTQTIEREKDDDTHKGKFTMVLLNDVDILRAICGLKDEKQ